MNPNLAIAIVIGALAVIGYLIYTHRLDVNAIKKSVVDEVAAVKGHVTSEADSLHNAVDKVHQAALAPVSVTVVSSAPPASSTSTAAASPPAAAAPASPAPAAAPAPAPAAPAAPTRVTWDPTGKTLEQFQAFRESVGMATPIFSALTGNPLGVAGQDLGDGSGDAAPAAFDPTAFGKAIGQHYLAEFTPANLEPKVVGFPIDAGSYNVSREWGAARGEMTFQLVANGLVLATDASPAFSIPTATTCVLTITPNRVTPEIVAQIAAQGAHGTYQITKA